MNGLLSRVSPQTLRLVALFLALLATVLFFSTQIEGYLSARMFNRISTSAAVVLPIAVGQAIVIQRGSEIAGVATLKVAICT